MSNPGEADATPISSLGALADWFASGAKPREAYTIGTEHESFAFRASDLRSPAYAPEDGSPGIRALLESIAADEGLIPILDEANPIGLKGPGYSISLEPGGQFELSGATLPDLHATRREFAAHEARLARARQKLGLGFLPVGFHPLASADAIPWMPKGRYAIMRRYMPKVGTRGLDMMQRTCTVQVNLDFSSEADMARKMRVAYALQPLATALFANSPFREGKPNGYLSNRALTWTDTDNARSGIPACVFEPGFGFAHYAEWLLDVPMYFVYRDGIYSDVAGASFRDFIAGRLAQMPGEVATIGDFADHATTAFPDVRLKRYIEMRGADAGTPAMMIAQSAFWVGLLYDEGALGAAYELIRHVTHEQAVAARNAVPRQGLDASLGSMGLRALAREAIAVAQAGLAARARLNERGEDERIHLAPLVEIAAGKPTQAEHWLGRYESAWNGDVTRLFAEAAFG